MKKIVFLVAIATITLLSACGNKTTSKSVTTTQHKLEIITTFYPMYEFTKEIVGDKANVKLLIPANVEPHEWEPSAKDMANIQKSDLLIYNHSALETWEPNMEKSLSSGVTFVQASKGIHLVEGSAESDEEASGKHLDPHVWLDPKLAIKEVKTITNAIEKKDPTHKSYYEKKSQEYIKQLSDLDKKFRDTLSNAKRKDIITQHAAFGYLAKAYGLNQVAISGLSPEEEPSPAKLAILMKFAKENHINIIYFEELASPKVAETLANEVGAKAVVLSPIEGISTTEQAKGMNYIKMMEQNLNALKMSLLQ